MFTIDVLMQAIIVAFAILEQERGRTFLSGLVTALEKGRMLFRITHRGAEHLVPAIGDLRQVRIEAGAQVGDDAGKRIGEILIFAAPETVPAHDDMAAELVTLRIGGAKPGALLRIEEPGKDRRAVTVQLLCKSRPVARRDALALRNGEGVRHIAPSLWSSMRFLCTPQR